MANNLTKEISPLQKKIIFILEVITTLILFFAPLKFSTIIGVFEVPNYYSLNPFWIVIGQWPIPIFFFISFALLLITILVLPLPNRIPVPLLLWGGISMTAILGIINASVPLYADYQIAHLLSVFAFALTIYMLIKHNNHLKQQFLIAISLATFATLIYGFHQYFWGFKENLELIKAKELKTGINITNSPLSNRLHQTLVFSTFSLSNNFASHIILTAPIMLALLWDKLGQCEPPKLSRALLFTPALILSLLVWYLTKSEAAIVGIVGAILFIVLFIHSPKKYKVIAWSSILSTVTLVILILLALHTFTPDKFNNLLNYCKMVLRSLEFRLDYYACAIKIFIQHPFAGTGWGDFFHDFVTIKSLNNNESPHAPHNLILSLFSQAGILAGLLSVIFLAYITIGGMIKLNTSIKKGDESFTNLLFKCMILLGLAAWAIHGTADISLQISSTIITMITLVIIFFTPDNHEQEIEPSSKAYRPIAYTIITITLLLGLLCSYRVITADYYMNKFDNYCNPRGLTKEEYLALSLPKIEHYRQQASKAAPNSPFPWALAANFAESRGLWSVAENYLKEAIKRSPLRASYYFHLGMTQLRQGKKEGIKNIKHAQKLFPHNQNYHIRFSHSSL